MASTMNGSTDHATHKPITSAAKVHASVIAQLRASGEPLTSRDMLGHSSIKELNLSDNSFYANVSNMKATGMIRRVPVVRSDQPGVKYGFELVEGEIIAKRKPRKPKSGPVAKTVMVAKPIIVAKAATTPAIKVDFVKSSGRLRIELNGMFLEIGVIE